MPHFAQNASSMKTSKSSQKLKSLPNGVGTKETQNRPDVKIEISDNLKPPKLQKLLSPVSGNQIQISERETEKRLKLKRKKVTTLTTETDTSIRSKKAKLTSPKPIDWRSKFEPMMADSATQSTDSPNQPKLTDFPKKPNSKRKKRSKTTNSPSPKLAVSSNQSKVKNPPNQLKSTYALSQPASKRKIQPKTTNSLKLTDPQPRIESTDSPTKSPIHPPSGNSPRPNSKKKKKLSKSAKLRLRAQQIDSPAQPTDSAIQPSNAALATQLPSPDSSALPKSKRQKLSKTTKSRSRAQQIDSPTQPDGSPIQPTSADSSTQPAKSKREKFKNSKSSSLRARMLSRLSAARFRFINQELYTWDGQKSTDLAFAKDPKTFEAYHSGFRQQAKLWPLNPIDSIIKSIRKMADFQNKIIADFGCGEAKLALELSQNKVYSFDLVALNDRVTVADNANTNLYAHSVDIAVHCLSLMSSKISAYLREANRVLKVGGILKIAEVESRFEDVDKFVEDVAKFNFRLARKDLSKNLFYFLDFEKTADIGLARKRKLPNLSLLPCMYKKR